MKLILLNGPPASGKSTLARRYADDHPPALALDVDRLRAMLGGWRAHPGEAGLLARDIAVAAARTHLSAGHDVVVPQLVARPGFPERLEALAGETGAAYHEFVLLPGRELARRRFETRGPSEIETAVPLTESELDRAYEAVTAFAASRRVTALTSADAYPALLASLT
ncbi:AAA family ATPase [Amycolatopsis australiensis]|uniref:Predicted kinase n=1 Tax=Amycolatopsis australiensis TaxID=546364 RepID=A0A1K1PAA2_9PSEU|nr:AAA family ATPase [Amycolatopsis australiensis]SFW44730.1 Predicted kinase [Amycolatopsis australiensis]